MQDLATSLRQLAAATETSEQAFRALHRFLVARHGPLGLALFLSVEGALALAGLIDRDGVERMPAHDPYGLDARLPRFQDELTRAVSAALEPTGVETAALDVPSARALGRPPRLLALPMLGAQAVSHWLVATPVGHVDGAALWHDALLGYHLLSRPLVERALGEQAQRSQSAIEGLADIQRLLQPDGITVRGLDYAVHWQAAETAAGDYYDLMPLSHLIEGFDAAGGDAFGVMLGDVSGHGPAAAMEAVQFDAILRCYGGDEEPGGPAGALTYANRHFFSRRQRPHFMTVFAASGRPDTGMLQYVCAGHPPALLRRADGSMERLGAGADADIPLGVLREHRWQNHATPFARGDVLVLYTDGIVEAESAGGEPFGVDRLARALGSAGRDAASVLDALREALARHQGTAVAEDDQTLIVLRRAD